MKRYNIQMINHNISSEWWKQIVEHFIRDGDNIEFRCWKEESAEISRAQCYGKAEEDGNELSIKAVITKELIEELMYENPKDKEIYNKMTKYFTLNVHNELCDICSAHYGTEMYITIYSDNDKLFFRQVMSKYTDDDFSVGEW